MVLKCINVFEWNPTTVISKINIKLEIELIYIGYLNINGFNFSKIRPCGIKYRGQKKKVK